MLIESLFWLTLNVYHEARDQPTEGKLAVAQVTLNRARKKKRTVEEVVLEKNQFSWVKQKPIVQEFDAFVQCTSVALHAMTHNDTTKGSTHFHANYVKPGWRKKMKRTMQIGDHIFYREE